MQLQPWPEGLPRSGNLNYEQLESVSPWFEVYKINQHTFVFLEPHHDEEVFSYLILGNQKAALVDTGMGIVDIRPEVEKITSLPAVVINTHTHFDHTGSNYLFDEIYCFDDDYEINNLKKGHATQFCNSFMQPGSYQNLPQGFDPMAYNIAPSNFTRKIKHLDRIDLGGRSLVIHHTPGHSPGSLCVEDTKHKILFTGDTFYSGTIFLHLPGSSFDDFIQSVNYLSSLSDQIDFLCPGHNEAYASKDVILSLRQGVEQVQKEQAAFEINFGSRFFQFEDFNLRLPL
ncbi:MAG: MBL fold metallo-hydrolase [Desulfobacteraceae bacterium]|nr:MBL fold metallo-hydrolase [Desulfobacteraceae bacterium]